MGEKSRQILKRLQLGPRAPSEHGRAPGPYNGTAKEPKAAVPKNKKRRRKKKKKKAA